MPYSDAVVDRLCDLVIDYACDEVAAKKRAAAPLTVSARVGSDNSVWVSLECFGVANDLGVYGPYDSREKADVAAKEAVAHIARQMQIQKDRLLAQIIDI